MFVVLYQLPITEFADTSKQMECAQINVTGGSGSVSPSTVSIPGMYKGKRFFHGQSER